MFIESSRKAIKESRDKSQHRIEPTRIEAISHAPFIFAACCLQMKKRVENKAFENNIERDNNNKTICEIL